MKTLSIKQPWASLVAYGVKNIENRTWKCPQKYLGQRILIHASGKPLTYNNFRDSILTDEQILSIPKKTQWDDYRFYVGAIIGSVVISDCVQNHPSVWAEKGCWNWVLKDAVLLVNPIMNVKGQLGFWEYHANALIL